MPSLEPENIIVERFALKEELGPSVWTAHDQELNDETLIMVLPSASTSMDKLQQVARQHRELDHAHLARVSDLHHDDDFAVLSIATSGRTLLSKQLEQTGPLPYREVMDKMRPIIDGLRHLHDQGIIHSGINAEHILVDETGTWQLLPSKPDGETLTSEMQQTGELFASVLLGGIDVPPGKEPNQLPDKLFGGRTLPALLNQLVTDMRSSSADRRPAGLGEVLKKLDQIDTLATAPEPDKTVPLISDHATSPTPAAPAPMPKRGFRGALIFVAMLGVMFVVGAIAIFTYIHFEDKKADAEEERRLREHAASIPSTPMNVEASATNLTAEVDLVKLATEKAEADEAQNEFLAGKRHAEGVGAHLWAAREFGDAMRAAGLADQAFLDKDYIKSAANYTKAAERMNTLVDGKEEMLEKLLIEGADQLIIGTTASATKVYKHALMIDPDGEGVEGLRRAKNVDKRNALLASAKDHEDNKRFAFAYTDFQEAAKLDPDSDRAIEGLARLKNLIAEDRFQAMMSAGLTAYHQGDFAQATKTLNDAKIFQPERPEVDEALEMVAEGIRLRKIEGHQQRALGLEKAEQWQEARKEYMAVLEIDSNIQFANQGRERAEHLITVMKKLDHYNQRPTLLLTPQGLQEAQLVLSQAKEVHPQGPKLERAHDLLARSVSRAGQKVKVTLTSDGETEVAVYKVGKFGRFETRQLELLPGTYTVVGNRNGYRDVRTQLSLEPGKTEASLHIVCTERF